MRAPDDRRFSKALAVLDPPPAEREKWRNQVHAMLDMQEFLFSDESDELEVGLGSRQGKAALARYIRALRAMRASYAALNPSIQRFLALVPAAIEHDIVEAGAMLVHKPSSPRKRPVNKRAQTAVGLARFLLEQRGCELTTARKGKWHTLAQTLADTSRDLRHHLTASLAENPKR
jgi:hypothetical protein